MAVTRKAGLPPLIMPSDAARARKTALAGSSTTKAPEVPGPDHVRVKRGAPARATAPGHVLFDLRAPGAR